MDERYCEKNNIGPGGDWCPQSLPVCVSMDIIINVPVEAGNQAQNVEHDAHDYVKDVLVNNNMQVGEPGWPQPSVTSIYTHSTDVTDERFKPLYDPDWDGTSLPKHVKEIDWVMEAKKQNESEDENE